MEIKICTKCQEVKTLSEFGKRKGNKCKNCICLSYKVWYENNKEKEKQKKKGRNEKKK